jgi:hypothetical protein
MATFYINGTTLANSTAVFTNSTLSICAPNGFYSDGSGISREQTDCVLGPIQACPSCLLTCGGPIINATEGPGIYSMEVGIGGEATDIGAVIINFYPAAIPDGIKVIYDGIEYNALSSAVDGRHKGALAGGYTYVGASTAVCLPIAGNTYPLNSFEYINSIGFVPTGGAAINITVDSGELSFSSGVSPGKCTMVIPKTSSSPNSLDISIIGVCPDTAFSIDIDCPVILTGYPSTTVQASSVAACGQPLIEQYYNAPVNGTIGLPALYDWVFEDAYGETILANGYYGFEMDRWMQVANGVIIAIGNC